MYFSLAPCSPPCIFFRFYSAAAATVVCPVYCRKVKGFRHLWSRRLWDVVHPWYPLKSPSMFVPISLSPSLGAVLLELSMGYRISTGPLVSVPLVTVPHMAFVLYFSRAAAAPAAAARCVSRLLVLHDSWYRYRFSRFTSATRRRGS